MIKNQVRSAGIIPFRFSRGKIMYLLLKHKQKGTHWGFPKGRINSRESKITTARRELFEETGLSEIIIQKEFLEKIKYSFKDYNVINHKEVTYFLAYSPNKKIKLSNEHSNYYWRDIARTLSKLDNKDTKKLLIKAHKTIITLYGPELNEKDAGEVDIISFPKAGRTWITFVISRILQKKFGFKREGYKRQARRCKADGKVKDELIYGLLRSEYKK